MHAFKRRLAKYSRWLHIYVSMTSFVIVFFFAVTGWTLNHAERFSGGERLRKAAGSVDTQWTGAAAESAKTRIADTIRSGAGVHGAVTDFRVDDDLVSVTFKGPGYSADALIDRKTGKYDVTESRLGAIAVLNDLHKGRDTGTAWAQVIDISAVLMVLVSLTGLTLIFFLQKRLTLGLWVLGIGTVVCWAVYQFLVS